MNNRDIEKISALIDYKLSMPCEVDDLRQLTESMQVSDMTEREKQEYIEKIYKLLKLNDLFELLGIGQPDFTRADKSLTEAKNIYSSDYYKWGW